VDRARKEDEPAGGRTNFQGPGVNNNGWGGTGGALLAKVH
jgi:hypothetical protein